MGGGTPSVLLPVQTASIFDALYSSFDMSEVSEITIEVNPGTVTRKKVESWKSAGINRISIGLQSADDRELKLLGRIHTFQEFLHTWELVRNAGFQNVNIDLISAIPGQTVKSWEKTLRRTADLKPEHISAYSLILEEGTPFYEKYGMGTDKGGRCMDAGLPDEDTEREIYDMTERILQEYGFARYEISNYAKQGYACRHNIGYWKRTEYLGLGMGAASLIKNRRFHRPQNLSDYINCVKNGERMEIETEILSQKEEMEEFMFLGLRMMKGISKKCFKETFQAELEECYGTVIRYLKENRLLDTAGDRVFLTKRGIDISNYVFEQFLL